MFPPRPCSTNRRPSSRQATIPHGDALLALGSIIAPVPTPIFAPASSTPTRNPAGPPLGEGYLAPFANPTLPDGFKLPYVKDLNLALADAITGQNIVNTVVLDISTTNSGGILNIPFVTSNANADSPDAMPPETRATYSTAAVSCNCSTHRRSS